MRTLRGIGTQRSATPGVSGTRVAINTIWIDGIRNTRRRWQKERAFARVEGNPTAGRDFVVGDVHGEFPTLETLLSRVGFAPRHDRLFALGDLVDRGPQSVDALAWMERGRIVLSVRGNHEQMLLRRIELAETNPREPTWTMHPWFARDVERTDWGRWKDMLRAMPIAATVGTRAGPIGLVHATPTTRHWDTMLAQLADGDTETMWLALNSTARARADARRAEHEGIPVFGMIDGVRAVVTGHTIRGSVMRTDNVWHIDTGAGGSSGALTLARIDVDPIEIMTMSTRD